MFFSSLLNAAPGAIAQGMLWGIMAIGVYITYRILDVADLTVDGSLATGGAVCIMLMRSGCNPWIALLCAFLVGMLAGMVTGLLHTRCGIPAILAGILTQLALYSVNLRIMGSKSNQPISVDKYNLVVSQRFVKELSVRNPLIPAVVTLAVLIGILYWFFGTEYGSGLRATGANRRMASAQGIDTRVAVTVGLMLSNGLVALSGALLAQYQGAVDVNILRFGDLLGKKKVSNPNFSDGILPHLWDDYGKVDWYVYQPTQADYRLLAGTVDEYLQVFRRQEEAQEHSPQMC